jgi:hypothetical protein
MPCHRCRRRRRARRRAGDGDDDLDVSRFAGDDELDPSDDDGLDASDDGDDEAEERRQRSLTYRPPAPRGLGHRQPPRARGLAYRQTPQARGLQHRPPPRRGLGPAGGYRPEVPAAPEPPQQPHGDGHADPARAFDRYSRQTASGRIFGADVARSCEGEKLEGDPVSRGLEAVSRFGRRG